MLTCLPFTCALAPALMQKHTYVHLHTYAERDIGCHLCDKNAGKENVLAKSIGNGGEWEEILA